MARTGELTPPGITRSARWYSCCDASVVSTGKAGCAAAWVMRVILRGIGGDRRWFPERRLTPGLEDQEPHADICSVRRYSTPVVLLAALTALLLPAQAFACNIPIRTIGPLDIKKGELRKPVDRATTREDWGLDDTWRSTRPRLNQYVILRHIGTYHGWSYRTQRALSIDAYGPEDDGWMYVEDSDPATPPCQMVGQIEWQAPKIKVKETTKMVRVLAVAQRTVGDRTGCILGPDQGVRDCPNLTRVVILLKSRVGDRVLSFEQIP
jgi:hypothetical protein